MKKKINSRSKGKRGERIISSILNDYYRTNEFKPVPMSGAFGTIHKGNLTESEAKVFQGDIITPDFFQWVIEVKNVKDVNLYKIFTNAETPWDDQVKQEKNNIKGKKDVILVFKQNNREWLAQTSKEHFKDIVIIPKIEFTNFYIFRFMDILGYLM